MEYEWWSGASWVSTETFVTSAGLSATVSTSTFTNGDYEWEVACKDSAGVTSSYSAARTFSVGTAPLAPTLVSPADRAVLALTAGVEFSWQFNDTGDSQSAYAFRRKNHDSGVYQWWSGTAWVSTETFITSTQQSTTISDWPASDSVYYWSVATKDIDGYLSPYSSERLLNPYEWWNGIAWVEGEAFITSSTASATVAIETVPDGGYKWGVTTKDQDGKVSPYSSENQFSIDVAPLVPTILAPTHRVAANLTTGVLFQWIFNDPGDAQGSFAIRRREYLISGTAAYEWWNGTSWVSVETFVTSTAKTVTISNWPSAYATYYFSIATRDSGGYLSPYSAERLLNPYEWWNGASWVESETFITSATSSATVAASTFSGDKHLWSVSTKDSLGVKGAYSTEWEVEIAGLEGWGGVHI